MPTSTAADRHLRARKVMRLLRRRLLKNSTVVSIPIFCRTVVKGWIRKVQPTYDCLRLHEATLW